jgi:putative phosphoesterase
MKIGVLADTHIPRTTSDLPKAVYKGLRGVDLILHAGDLIVLDVLHNLMALAPTEAVCGNMDSAEVTRELPRKKIVTAGTFRIGLIHGWGNPRTVVHTISKEFHHVDAIVFGHSHEPMNEVRNNVLYFNPGSPTDTVFAPYTSYGILELEGSIKGTIVKL